MKQQHRRAIAVAGAATAMGVMAHQHGVVSQLKAGHHFGQAKKYHSQMVNSFKAGNISGAKVAHTQRNFHVFKAAKHLERFNPHLSTGQIGASLKRTLSTAEHI